VLATISYCCAPVKVNSYKVNVGLALIVETSKLSDVASTEPLGTLEVPKEPV